MIPQETIEQIRQITDIVQIIGEYVRLKKRGRNFISLCPFHTEKTASFSVSPEKQVYYCFGCGKGGNVFTFLMEHEKMSFIEAVRHLASKTNIAIIEDKLPDFRRELLDRLNFANQTAIEYFQKTLHKLKYSEVLERYLKGRRTISADTMDYFKIGLAGDEWEGLINYARRKDISLDDLEKAGLILYSEKNRKHFDRFRQRLMFPIMNLSQKPIAFGGADFEERRTG